MWELKNKENWKLISSETRNVVYKDGTKPSDDKYRYTPIPPIFAAPNSNVLLVGIRSESALPHWFLGARVSQYLYVSPSNSPNLVSGVQVAGHIKAGLNRLTLCQFLNYGIYPYVVQLDIPYWLEDIYVEVWEYRGLQLNEDVQYENIMSRLNNIETKIDNLYS